MTAPELLQPRPFVLCAALVTSGAAEAAFKIKAARRLHGPDDSESSRGPSCKIHGNDAKRAVGCL